MKKMQKIREQLAPYIDAITLEEVMEDGYVLYKITAGDAALFMGHTKAIEEMEDGDNDLAPIDLMHTLTDKKSYDELLSYPSLAVINEQNKNTVAMRVIKMGRIHDVTSLLLDNKNDLGRIVHVIRGAAGLAEQERTVEQVEPEISSVLTALFEETKFALKNKGPDSVSWQYSDGENPPIDYFLNRDEQGYPKLDIRVPVPDDYFERHATYDLLTKNTEYNIQDFRDHADMKIIIADNTASLDKRRGYAALFNTQTDKNYNTRMYVHPSGQAEAICSISLNVPVTHDVLRAHTQLVVQHGQTMFRAPKIDPYLFQTGARDALGQVGSGLAGKLFKAIFG